MAFETLKNLYRWGKAKYQQWRILKYIDMIQQRQKERQKELDRKAKKRAKDLELFYLLFPEERRLDQIKAQKFKDAQAKDQSSAFSTNKQKQVESDPRKVIENKKTQPQINQLKEIEEVGSDLEESDCNQDLEVASQFNSRDNQLQLTTALKNSNPQKQSVQRRQTELLTQMSSELSFFSQELNAPFKTSKEEKCKERKSQMMRIIFEIYDFNEKSESLLEEIQKKQKFKEFEVTQKQSIRKLVLSELADLNNKGEAIQYAHQRIQSFVDFDDYLKQQFVQKQDKGEQ